LVLAFAAVVGPAEREAFAQPRRDHPAKSKKQEKKDHKEGEGAAAQDEQRKEEEKKAEEQKKPADPGHGSEEKHELDTRVEQPKAVYISGDLAFTRSDLGGLSDNTGLDRTVANGVLYGLSAGLRLKDFRFGARWRVYDTTEFALWSLAVSAGYGLPLRPVSPVFSAHLGYVWDQDIQSSLFRKSLPTGTVLPPDIDVKGILLGFDVNASYWVTRFVRLGAFVGADFMFLSREKASPPATIFGPSSEVEGNPLYSQSGSSIGLNVNLGLRGAFDIAFK
jgi:hypothetical protein